MSNRQQRRRVVVTGMGAVTPLGQSVDEFWDGLVQGRSGIGPMTLCDPAPFPCRIAGEVKGFDPGQFINPKEARRMARFSQLSKEDMERMGIVMGIGSNSFPTTEENARILVERGPMRMSPFFIPMILPNMAASNVSRILGIKGYSSTVTTACAASTQSIGEAVEVIRRGAADVVLGGGCEAGISQLGLGGFCVIHALSTRNEEPERASRPFDAQRDGFVPSEGAALLVLESLEHALSRGANILAEVIGYGASSDAFHLVQPDEDGAGAARAMGWALSDAGLAPEDIDYINAHGTSTPKNDETETLAIKRVFKERAYKVPISSTKSEIGHGLGGAGALEAIACVKTIQEGIIHPTINYEHPDPACDLDYVPNVARRQEVRTVLSNSFGFGGQNACLVFARFEE